MNKQGGSKFKKLFYKSKSSESQPDSGGKLLKKRPSRPGDAEPKSPNGAKKKTFGSWRKKKNPNEPSSPAGPDFTDETEDLDSRNISFDAISIRTENNLTLPKSPSDWEMDSHTTTPSATKSRKNRSPTDEKNRVFERLGTFFNSSRRRKSKGSSEVSEATTEEPDPFAEYTASPRQDEREGIKRTEDLPGSRAYKVTASGDQLENKNKSAHTVEIMSVKQAIKHLDVTTHSSKLQSFEKVIDFSQHSTKSVSQGSSLRSSKSLVINVGSSTKLQTGGERRFERNVKHFKTLPSRKGSASDSDLEKTEVPAKELQVYLEEISVSSDTKGLPGKSVGKKFTRKSDIVSKVGSRYQEITQTKEFGFQEPSSTKTSKDNKDLPPPELTRESLLAPKEVSTAYHAVSRRSLSNAETPLAGNEPESQRLRDCSEVKSQKETKALTVEVFLQPDGDCSPGLSAGECPVAEAEVMRRKSRHSGGERSLKSPDSQQPVDEKPVCSTDNTFCEVTEMKISAVMGNNVEDSQQALEARSTVLLNQEGRVETNLIKSPEMIKQQLPSLELPRKNTMAQHSPLPVFALPASMNTRSKECASTGITVQAGLQSNMPAVSTTKNTQVGNANEAVHREDSWVAVSVMNAEIKPSEGEATTLSLESTRTPSKALHGEKALSKKASLQFEVTQGKAEYNRKGVKEVITKATTTSVKSEIKIPPILKKVNVEVKSTESKLSEKPGKLKDRISVFENKTTSFKEKEFFVTKNIAHSPKFSKKFTGRTNLKINRPSESKIMEGEKKIDGLNKSDEVGVWRNNQGDLQTATEQPDHTENTVQSNTFNQNQISTEKTSVDSTSLGTSTNIKTTTETSKSSSETPQLENNNCDIPKQKIELIEKAKTEVIETKAPIVIKEELPSTVKPEAIVFLISNRSAPGTSSKRQTSEVVTVTSGALSSVDEGKTKAPAKEENMSAGDSLAMQQTTVITQIQEQVTQVKNKAATENTFNVQESTEQPLPDAKQQRFTGIDTCRLQLGRNTAQNSPSSAHATANQQLHLNNVPKEQDPSAISQQNKIIQEKTDTKNKLLVSVLDLNTVKQQSNDLVDAKIEFSASEKHITTQQKTSGTVVKTVSKLPTSGQKSPIKEQSDISLQTGSKLPRPVQKSTCKQLSINDTEQHPESNLSKVEKDPHTSLQQNTTNPQPDNIVLKTVSELSTSEQKSPIKDKSGNVLQTGSKLPRPVEKGTSKQLSNYDSVNATSESVKLVQQDSTEQQSNSNILQTVKKPSTITQSDDVIKAESELAMPGEKSTSVKKSESSIVQMVKEFSTPVQQSAESTVVKTAGELPTTGEKSFTKKQSEVSIVQAEEYLPKSELKRSENLAETASELTISGQKSYVAQHEKELNISVQQAAIKVQSETTTKTLSKSSIVQEEKVSKLVQDSTTKVQSDTSVVKVTEEFTTKGQESPAKKQSESNTVQAGKDLPKSVLNNTTKVQSENVVEATSELTTSGQKSSVKMQSETSIAQKELTRTGLESSAKKQSERNIVQLGKDLPMSVQNVDEATSELTIPGQKSKKPSECGVQQMEEELSTSGQQTKIIKVQSDGEVVKTIGELSGTGQESSKKPSESIVQAQKDLPRSEQNVVEATNKLTSSVQERTVQKQSEAIITQTESKLPIPEHEICTTQQQSKSNVSHKGPILVQQNAVKEQSESSVVKTVSEPPTTVKESKVKKQSDCNTVHTGSGLPALVEQCTEEKKDLSLNAAASVEYPNKSKSNKTENESAENASLEQVQDSSHKQENKLPTSNITGGPLQNVQMESLSQPTSVTAIQSNTTNSPISEKEATTSLTDITKSEFKNKKPLQYSDLNKGPEVLQNAAAKQCIVGAKSRLSSEIVLKSPAQFNKRDTPSNWLDVEQSCGQKEQNLKNKLNTSESDDSVLDTSGDLESFVENIRNLGNPFSLPQKRLKPLKSPAPPFAMPPIKEDRFEKTLDPDVFKFGLGKKEKSRDTPSSTLFKLQSMEAKSKLIPKRSSAEQSILFKSHQSRSINSVETQNPGNSGNESVDGVVRRSRLEKSSIVSSLLSPSTTPRMNLSATTSTALSTVLSPSETETALSQETKSTTSLFLPSTSSQLGLLTGTSQTSLLLNGVDGSIKEHAKPSFLTNDLLGPVSVEFPTPQFLDIKLPSIVDKYLKPDDTKTAPVPENSFQMPEFKLPEFPQSGLESSSDYNVSRFANGSQNFSGLYNPSLLGTQALIPGMPSQNMEIPVSDQRRTHKRPGKLVIYDQPQFSGEANEIFRDVEDATSFKLSPVISVRVVRGCWIFYEKPHFQGRSIALEEGQTELVNVWNEVACEENAAGDSKPDTPAHMVIGSIKLAVKDYRVPEIDLFTDPKGMGRKMTFFDDSLETCTYGILINTSSIKVHSGVWLVFEEPGFCGCSCILEPGEYPYPESWGFQHPIVGSLRPLKMGGLKVEHPNEPKAIVYEKPFFEGKHLEIESDAFSFNEGDDNEDHATCWVKKLGSVGSIKILRGIWVGYEKPGFEGHQYLMEEGQFENWKDWGGYCEQLQSLRPIIADFLAPHMKLYSEKDFGKKGHTMDLLELVPNMEDTGFGEITQSAEVISGVWVAFEDPGFSGQHYILEKGMYSSFEDWGAQTFKLSSVQPIFLENIYGLKVKFKVQLFSEPGFQGSSQTLEESVSVLPEGISVKSCKVLTGSWVVYEEEMFGGKQYLVEEGNYPDLTAIGCPSLNTCIKSVQIIDFEFSEPYIMLFAKENFRGKKIVLKDTAASLQLLGFNAHIFSVQVGGGIWVVYEQSNYRGEQMLLAPSEISSWHRYSGWHKIGSLRPVYQKRVFFRLRNRATGTLMSVTGSLEDIKLSRIQAVEDTGAEDHIWFFQEGLLRCRAVEDCCLETTGTIVIAGNRLGLSPEPGKENHFWSISPDGLIRFRLKPECVLEVKGGEQYDKNQVILNTFDENKQNQRWDMEIL